MATSSVNLPPISPTITNGSYRNLEQTGSGFGFSKTSFVCGGSKNNNLFFSTQSRRALTVRKFNPPSASNSFNHIPKQFREENLKDGLMDNFKNVPQSLYGLNPGQLDLFAADDGPLSIKQQAENVKLESLSSAYSYLNDGGLTSRAGMNRMRDAGCSMYSMAISRGGGGVRRPRNAPPDLPSIFLDARIVYLGMPIYKAVSELIVAEFLYLDFDDNTKPIYLYINSTGTQNANQEIIASENDAYAIADCMAATKAKVYTVNVAEATGQAAMLLSLGEKGHRALQPNASTKLHMPKMFAISGATTDMWIRAKALNTDNEYYLDLLSKGIGKPKDEIAKDIRFGKYMQPEDAIAYGVADRIIEPGDDAYEKRNHDELKAAAIAKRKARGLGPPRDPSFGGARAK